jgi:hypothetical protein
MIYVQRPFSWKMEGGFLLRDKYRRISLLSMVRCSPASHSPINRQILPLSNSFLSTRSYGPDPNPQPLQIRRVLPRPCHALALKRGHFMRTTVQITALKSESPGIVTKQLLFNVPIETNNKGQANILPGEHLVTHASRKISG